MLNLGITGLDDSCKPYWLLFNLTFNQIIVPLFYTGVISMKVSEFNGLIDKKLLIRNRWAPEASKHNFFQ